MSPEAPIPQAPIAQTPIPEAPIPQTPPRSQRLAVSLDVSAVPADPVGAGRYTIELARALARRDDVELLMWSRRNDTARWRQLDPDGAEPPLTLRAQAPDSRAARLVWEQLRLGALLAGTGARLHHGPHYTMPARPAVPVVVTLHDLTFFDHPEWHERSKVVFFRRAIRRAAVRARAVVCVSERTAALLHERVAVRTKVFVVPHGVDHTRFRPDEVQPGADDEVLGTLGVRRPYLLFLGTLEPRKAVPDLVRAFGALATERPELTLVLAGTEGWGAQAVTRTVAECAVTDRVLRTGYVTEPAVPALLRQAAAVVYPAHEEGFGLPALEALACGTPLVTTAGTAMADVAGDAAALVGAGRPHELTDAVRAVLSGGPEVERRRRLGLSVAASYTWERSAAAHVEAYRWAAPGPNVPEEGRQGDR